jgi:hypothetical protein
MELRRSGAVAEQVNRGSPEQPKTNQPRLTELAEAIF